MSHYISVQPDKSYFIEILGVCTFQQPVTMVTTGRVGLRHYIGSVLSPERAWECMDQQTLQGELCSAYFGRMKASIPNCLKLMKHPPGPPTPPRWAPPPWLPGSPPMGHSQASPARPRILGPHL